MKLKLSPTSGPATGSSPASSKPDRRATRPLRRRFAFAWRPNHVSLLWVLPALLFVGGLFYGGVVSGALYAFTDWNGISSSAKYVGLDNFKTVFNDPVARQALEHTLVLAFSFVITVTVVGLALALALHRSVKSRFTLRAVMFAPVVMSPLALSFVWQFIFQTGGPLNAGLRDIGLGALSHPWLSSTHWAIVAVFIVMVWQFAGLPMVIFLAGLESIPDELDEAAAVDGASAWYRFRRVTFPLLAPSLTISLTLTLVIGLRLFDQVWALTGGGPVNATETLATQVYEQTFVNGRFGYGTALALVLTLLVAIAGTAQLLILRARERRLA